MKCLICNKEMAGFTEIKDNDGRVIERYQVCTDCIEKARAHLFFDYPHGKKCERCGYILNERDNEPQYRLIEQKRWNTDNEREIVLCRFCNNDLDNFVRGFPIWSTREFKEVSARYQGQKINKELADEARFILSEYNKQKGVEE